MEKLNQFSLNTLGMRKDDVEQLVDGLNGVINKVNEVIEKVDKRGSNIENMGKEIQLLKQKLTPEPVKPNEEGVQS